MSSCYALLAAGLFLALVPGPKPALAQDPVATALVVDSGNRFGMDLYAQLKTRPGNLFFSPYSISTALTMTYAGARGRTAVEMARVLYVSIDGDGWHQAVAAQMKELNAPQGYELTVANSLWGQKGYVFLPEYLALAGKYYGGEIELVDFANTSVAAGRINTWVSDKTRGKIQEIVSTHDLSALTRLVLVNAVYFKGTWANPFKKIHTQNGRFYVTPQSEKIVAMMDQQGNFAYMENDLLQVLELPYAGKDISMVLLLPRKADGLAQAEEVFDLEHYKEWVAALSEREVKVTLPKFKNTSAFSVARILAAMGITEAFSDIADFSGMSAQEALQISDVLHKAFVDVSEEGTEAAAATAVVMELRMAFEGPSSSAVSFVADHPFLFVIRDRRTDSILFMGRILDPDVGARAVGDVLSGVWGEVVGQALKAQQN